MFSEINFFMKAKEYFEQIKPHIGADSFPKQLMEMTKSIILEGNEISKQRQIKKLDSLKSVFSECNLKFLSVCRMIEKETDSYTLDNDLFFIIFKAMMPDVYLMLYSN